MQTNEISLKLARMLLSLSTDLLSTVYQYLDLKDLGRLACASKKMKEETEKRLPSLCARLLRQQIWCVCESGWHLAVSSCLRCLRSRTATPSFPVFSILCFFHYRWKYLSEKGKAYLAPDPFGSLFNCTQYRVNFVPTGKVVKVWVSSFSTDTTCVILFILSFPTS